MNQIYAAGAITGLTNAQHFVWRDKLAFLINDCTCGKWNVFNPSIHISEVEEFNMKEREAMDYDLFHLLRSDLMVVNFNYNPASIGTVAEMGAAYTHQIPIIGLNETNEKLHPWQIEMCLRIFTNIDMMINYLCDHFINEK